MRKFIVLFICAAAIFTAAAGCAKKEQNIVFTGTIEQVSDASIFVTTSDDMGFDRASVLLADDIKISFNLLAGQIVKLTILPEIRESYPVQVTAVAIELVAEPASPDPASADYTASFFRADNHVDGCWNFIRNQAANADKMVAGSVRHEIGDAAVSGDTLSVAVKTIVPEADTHDFADWFILLSLPKEEIAGVQNFDAYYA